MKVLIICSYNSGTISPFVKEQVNSLREIGVKINYFKVKGRGVLGYLKNISPLKEKIRSGNYDLIHAHYGLSGFLANLQRIAPVITTYHGSDVHYLRNRFISFISSRLSEYNILTNNKQIKQLGLSNNFIVQPCGIDIDLFVPMEQSSCRSKMGLPLRKRIILFSSSFNKEVKNAKLAQKAVDEIKDAFLLELRGYSREEVALLINASDAVLITSYYETGPLIAKEALACNTPVISTDVGDVKSLIEGLSNCYITSYDPKDIAQKLSRVLENNGDCRGRPGVQDFELQNVGQSVKKVYSNVLKMTNS